MNDSHRAEISRHNQSDGSLQVVAERQSFPLRPQGAAVRAREKGTGLWQRNQW